MFKIPKYHHNKFYPAGAPLEQLVIFGAKYTLISPDCSGNPFCFSQKDWREKRENDH
jgi:hypothetical protein